MDQLKECIIMGRTKDVEPKVKELLEKGILAEVIMNEALIPAMDDVGVKFQNGEYYLPEMLIAAKAMQLSLKVLKPILAKSNIDPLGRVVIGTVKGDLHDIGKNLVGMALEGAGFEVIDLGADVAPEKFVDAIRMYKPKLVGLSALLTTTMLVMKDVVEAIKKAGLRTTVKVMVGGAPLHQKFADEIGADFYGPDSTTAKNYARSVA
jgi:5-methyltetrahydrofolate--homocysteine methyltransferase